MKFLFEIGLEELPSRYVDEAERDLKKFVEKELAGYRIKYDNILSYSTPRRIAVIINGLSEKQEDLDKKSIGPSVDIAFKDGKLTKAGEGFLKSQNATENDVKIVENDKGKYISIEQFVAGKKTKEILPDILSNVIKSIEFEKNMKWSTGTFRFARPIKWFVTVFDDGSILPFEFSGLKGGNITRGMRNFASQEIIIDSPDNYIETLEKKYVIAEHEKRKNMILKSIKENCEQDGEKAIISNSLLEEVVNLLEYPYAIKGEFSKDFLLLPEDIITITMETHQRYFPVKDKDGNLSNKFILIRNAPEYSEVVKKGNEKVIVPRLADAKFFYDEDLKKNLSDNVEKLKDVMFQKDMGTIFEKISRIKEISKYLLRELNYVDKEKDTLKIAELSKADLVSNVIGEKEFTKLQGLMGSIYAEKQGENKIVSKGIFEHYLPRYQGDIFPETIEGAVVGIADRIDTVVGCFSVGLKPTSSKDPYSLRRSVQAILQIAENLKLSFDYIQLIEFAYNTFKKDKKVLAENVVEDIIILFKQRIYNVLGDKYSKELINYEINLSSDIVELDNKLEILSKLASTDKFKVLINLLKRVQNIIKDSNDSDCDVNVELFEKTEEKELYDFTVYLKGLDKQFDKYIETLINNENVVNKYFENVIINSDNKEIQKNRINLLRKYYSEIQNILEI